MSTKPTEAPVYDESLQLRPSCDGCGRDDVALRDVEDEGDYSVGYGPITLVLCAECEGERKI